MVNVFSIYKTYPYKIPARVRFFNTFRYFFKLAYLEKFLLTRLVNNNRWWRRLIPPVYFYKQNTIREARRDGLNYKLDISCLIDHAIFFCTLREPAWDNLFKLLQKNSVVLDIGANIGFLTLKFSDRCPDGHVFAFEPDKKTFGFLTSNIELNDVKNVTAVRVALGDRIEKMILHRLYVNNPGANRILPKNLLDLHEQDEVEVTTLTQVVRDLGILQLDVIKIDVEGFEMFVLKGGESVIKKWKPILFIELAEVNLNQQGLTARLLIEYVEGLSYEVRDARTMQIIDKFKPDHHTDILCFYKKIT